MRVRLKKNPTILEIFPNRGGKISIIEGSEEEAVVEGGVPKAIALNSLKVMISLGVLIQTPTKTIINKNSIHLRDPLQGEE